MNFLAIGLCMFATVANALGEALVVKTSVENMGRNPEMYGKLRTAMILGCALVETTAIYCLLVAILILFVG